MSSGHAGGWHAHCVGSHVRHRILHVVVLRWWWGLVFKSAKFVLLSLKVVISVRAHLTIRTSLVSTTMSETWISFRSVTTIKKTGRSLLGKIVGSREGFATVRANIRSLLSVGTDMPEHQKVSGWKNCDKV